MKIAHPTHITTEKHKWAHHGRCSTLALHFGLSNRSAEHTAHKTAELSSQIKVWGIPNGRVELSIIFGYSDNRFNARVIKKDEVTMVAQEWISGISAVLQEHPGQLTRFLENTYVIVNRLEGSGFRIYVHHKLLRRMPGGNHLGAQLCQFFLTHKLKKTCHHSYHP